MAPLLSFWRTPQAALPANEVRELTAQFYITLEASFIKVKGASPPRSQHAHDRVSELLDNGPRNWTNAYAIEQLLVHLFDDGTLANELQVRVREARDALKPALGDYYAAESVKTPMSADERRAVLSRLINDLQWRYTVNEVKRGYAKEITLKTGQMFVAALVVFAGAVLLTLVWPGLLQFDLRLLVPAVLAGCWGASFSMLSSLRDRLDASGLDALKVLRARWVLGSRVLIGAGGACILYFFFVAGLVSGAAFPDLKGARAVQIASAQRAASSAQPAANAQPAPIAQPAPNAPPAPGTQAADSPPAATEPLTPAPTNNQPLEAFALLVVWCFLAGFSERLIPGLLAKTEGKLDPPSSTPDRYRPTSAPSGGDTSAAPPTAPAAPAGPAAAGS